MTNPLLKAKVTVKIISNLKGHALIHRSCGQPRDGAGPGGPGGPGRREWPGGRSWGPPGTRGSSYSHLHILATGSQHQASRDPQRCSHWYLDVGQLTASAGAKPAALGSFLSSPAQAREAWRRVGGRAPGSPSWPPLWPWFPNPCRGGSCSTWCPGALSREDDLVQHSAYSPV